jgi:predicted component of type VI protein secretion system
MPLPHRLHAATPVELQARLHAERRGTLFLLLRDPGDGQQLVELAGAGPRVTVGRNAANHVALPWDPEVSRVHAALECAGDEWTVVDEGSRNGSYVNGERLQGRRRLRDGDVLTVGRTPVVYVAPGDREADATAAASGTAAVAVTPAQRRVLVALCRPVLSPDGTGVPASNRQIADELVLGADTVKAHLRTLFEAFGIEDVAQNAKRAVLARTAVERGLVTQGDLAGAASRPATA